MPEDVYPMLSLTSRMLPVLLPPISIDGSAHRLEDRLGYSRLEDTSQPQHYDHYEGYSK
jgi:hypothetical protein